MRKLVILLITIVSLCVFLGLAVLGWGGFGRFFSHRVFIVMTVITLLLGASAMFTEGNLSSGKREDRSNRWVFWAFGLLTILGGWAPAYTDRIGFWTFGGEGVRWVGLALFTLGGVLRIIPVFVLGQRFSGLVAIQEGHQLVTTGIYGLVRNPSYLGMIVTVLGWALLFRSGVGLIFFALILIPVIGRIRAEEKMLSSQFGAEWEAYKDRTWRLVPCIY
jgi:protein-S-isoprenylcysteine O-methyltransferase Ste14